MLEGWDPIQDAYNDRTFSFYDGDSNMSTTADLLDLLLDKDT